MHTALMTPAGEALRAMLPAGADPYATIELACHTAFLVRDRAVMPGLDDVAKTDPELTAGLVITLAALVDIDTRPDDMLAWLGTHEGREQEHARMIGALVEAREEYDEAAADTLPEVTLESMRDLIHAARLAGVQHPCGTPAGAARHNKRGQRPCFRCLTARRIYVAATDEERALVHEPLPHPNYKTKLCDHPPVECGTLTGYDHHIRREQAPCADCRSAMAAAIDDIAPMVRHGTAEGYEMHRNRHEKACSDCEQAIKRLLSEVVLLPATKRKSCGSHAGYNAHVEAGETQCVRCRRAQARYDAERRVQRVKDQKWPATWRKSCGTMQGYRAHTSAGEHFCEPCREAQHEQYLSRKAQKASAEPVVATWPEQFVADLLAEQAERATAESAA